MYVYGRGVSPKSWSKNNKNMYMQSFCGSQDGKDSILDCNNPNTPHSYMFRILFTLSRKGERCIVKPLINLNSPFIYVQDLSLYICLGYAPLYMFRICPFIYVQDLPLYICLGSVPFCIFLGCDLHGSERGSIEIYDYAERAVTTLATNFFTKWIQLTVWNVIYFRDLSMTSKTVGTICIELHREG